MLTVWRITSRPRLRSHGSDISLISIAKSSVGHDTETPMTWYRMKLMKLVFDSQGSQLCLEIGESELQTQWGDKVTTCSDLYRVNPFRAFRCILECFQQIVSTLSACIQSYSCWPNTWSLKLQEWAGHLCSPEALGVDLWQIATGRVCAICLWSSVRFMLPVKDKAEGWAVSCRGGNSKQRVFGGILWEPNVDPRNQEDMLWHAKAM